MPNEVSDVVKNRVLLTLWILLVLALGGMSLLTLAPNRLISGTGVPLGQVLNGAWRSVLIPAVLLLLPCLLPQKRLTYWAAYVLSGVLLGALWSAMAWQSLHLAGGEESLARVSLGGGAWLATALCLLAGGDALQRLTSRADLRIGGVLLLLSPVALLLFSGALRGLSLMKEYANRADVFDLALFQHLGLLLGTLLFSALLGIPLGVAAVRRPRWRSPLFSTLNVIQTIPSIALFGLLIAPLAGLVRLWPWLGSLGISGIGAAPALIALVLYALLPLVRGVVTGLEQVPPAVIEAARGVGMTRGQILLRVECPLALPVVLSGMRVVAVQTVGMAVVAALIGAGGFGAIVFQGLLSSALDLVLLGVIPVVLLAAAVDTLFKLWVSRLETVQR